jgi:hypothetical protein
VLASRRPRHPVGWLLLALALSLTAAGLALMVGGAIGVRRRRHGGAP